MTGNQLVNEEIMPSFLKAGKVFKKEGLRVEPALDASGLPGIMLIDAEESVTITMRPLDTDEELYQYRVSSFGYDTWTFPSIHMPDQMPAFPVLPRLYSCLRFGMPEKVTGEPDLMRMFQRTRLQGFYDRIEAFAPDVAFMEEKDPETGKNVPYVLLREGTEELRFTYEYVIPRFHAAVLQIAHEEERAYLPEFGSLPDRKEYEAILQTAFSV